MDIREAAKEFLKAWDGEEEFQEAYNILHRLVGRGPIKFTVTEDHLKESIVDCTRNSFTFEPTCEGCILATAIEEAYPGLDVSVDRLEIFVDGDYYEHTDISRQLVNLFDTEKFDEIQKQLPLTLKLELKPYTN